MNYIIANKFKELISTLPFVDVIAGLTKLHKENQPVSSGSLVQSFPVECAVTLNQVRGGDYIDLSPDESKISILYFEDLGVQFAGKNVGEIVYQSRLRLIGWLNLNRFVDGGCSMSAQVIANILAVLPFSQTINIGGPIKLTKVKVVSSLEMPKNADIFLRYSYDETKTQYLMHPFDFFALELTSEFTLPFGCIPEIEIKAPVKC